MKKGRTAVKSTVKDTTKVTSRTKQNLKKGKVVEKGELKPSKKNPINPMTDL